VKKGADGWYQVNGKSYGSHGTVEALVEALHTPVPGWPVPLTRAVETDSGASSADDAIGMTWLAVEMSKADSEAMLGGKLDGNFLVRPTNVLCLVLSVSCRVSCFVSCFAPKHLSTHSNSPLLNVFVAVQAFVRPSFVECEKGWFVWLVFPMNDAPLYILVAQNLNT
jgi:hypothetical protein